MRTKTLVVILVLAVGGAVFLWWKEASSGSALGCYTTPVTVLPLSDSGAVRAADCGAPLGLPRFDGQGC
ncbi:hypothetical protein [Dactylosporangium sp. NPDC005555]|uniref:hypothetical protein n=1 Tax=Dactylosporangium sp. NPDC005555 TaxID=3154889 RepID=UPI0033B77030